MADRYDEDFIFEWDDEEEPDVDVPSAHKRDTGRQSAGRDGSRKGSRDRVGTRTRGTQRSAPSSRQKYARSAGASKRRRRRRRRHQAFRWVLPALIVLMLLIAVVRLIVWNIGQQDDAEISEDFSTEAMDYIQALDADLLAGHEDDGITTILALGNAPFSDERGEDGLAELIASSCDAVVYNAAFPDSYISMKNETFDTGYPQDAMSLYLVTASFCSGDYTMLEYGISLLEENQEAAAKALTVLQETDYSSVDMIVIMYDLSDYKDQRPVMDENNDINLLTWNGALNASLQLIQETYPYIRIVVLSPGYGQFTDEEGNLVDPDTMDYGNGVLPDYVTHEINIAISNGVSILDNYYGTIIPGRAEDYLTDGYHLNLAGRQLVAARFAAEIFGVS